MTVQEMGSYFSLSFYLLRFGKLLAVAACTIVVCAALLYRWLLPRPIAGIPYNREATQSLLGDAPSMKREVSHTGEVSAWLVKQVHRMQSPLCQVFILPFRKPWLLLADFREAQDILLRRHGRDFDNPTFFSDGMTCLGDITARYPTNAAFKSLRHLKQDLMAPPFLNNYMGPFIYGIGMDLVELLQKKLVLAQGRPFSVLEDLDYAALDVMLYYAFGDNNTDRALGPQSARLKQTKPFEIPESGSDQAVEFPRAPLSDFLDAFHHAPDVMEKATVSWAPKLTTWIWSWQTWYKRIFSVKTKQMAIEMEKAQVNQRDGNARTAMELMLQREALVVQKKGGLGNSNIIDEIFGDIVSGHHTTGSSMCWTIKFLTENPRVQSKLRAELYGSMPSAVRERRQPTFEEIRGAHMPYLDAVMAEELRLTPFSVVRETLREVVILGHVVPKGCQVFMVNAGPGYQWPALVVDDEKRSQSSLAARKPGKWDESKDLKLFDPDRWLKSLPDGTFEFNKNSGPQLGFGGGVRQCWGQKLAVLEVRTILSLLVWNLEFQPIPSELAGFAAFDGFTRSPQRGFARLARMDPSMMV